MGPPQNNSPCQCSQAGRTDWRRGQDWAKGEVTPTETLLIGLKTEVLSHWRSPKNHSTTHSKTHWVHWLKLTIQKKKCSACLWVPSCPFGDPALAASHLAGRFTSKFGVVWPPPVSVLSRAKSAMGQLSKGEGQRWFSYLLRTSFRRKLHRLISVPGSAGLPGHYSKLLVIQQLAYIMPVYRN